MTHDRAQEGVNAAIHNATGLTENCLAAELLLRKLAHQGVLTADGLRPDFIQVDETTGCVRGTSIAYADLNAYAQAITMTAAYMAQTEVVPGLTIQAVLERVARA